MVDVWSEKDNLLLTDFDLYSSYDDMRLERNKWQYCNYDDKINKIGSFRECSPAKAFIPASQWYSANKKYATMSLFDKGEITFFVQN
jgi:hypothetical protein